MKLRPLTVLGVLVLLLAAGGAAALYLSQKREVTTSSDEARRVYREAVENERRYYFREARIGFARALELDDEFAMAMVGMARQAEREQALALLRRAEKLKPRLTDRERRLIDLSLAARNGKTDEAEKIALGILDDYPEDFRATSYCAARQVERGDMDSAVALFKRLLEVDPNSAEAYNLLGYYHAYRGELEQGIEYLKKYQFMSPDQANPHDSLGEVLAYSGRYDEAIQALEQALKVKPDFFASYAHLAVAYTGKGDYKRAREMWMQQAENAENDNERYTALMLALVTALEARDRAAIDLLAPQIAKLTEKNKDLANGKHALAALLALSKGRGAEAEAELAALKPKLHEKYDELIRRVGRKPYFDSWNFMMAHAKRMQGKNDEAIALLEEMIDPPTPWASFPERQWIYDARAELATILAERGELDRAEKLLAENHKWNPSWAPAREAELTVARLRREKVLAAAK
ncbi:MAG TPA: tetratricopeptide repeat protein [Thermoanaerobaculia bacterium]